MDYANERWIKVYTRDTAGWLAMSWEAQGLGILLARKMEPATGEISLGRRGLSAVIGLLGPTARWEKVEPFIRELLDEGRIEYDDERKVLVDRDHPARQGAQASPTVRKQMQRARATASPRHAESRAVTPGHDQREEIEEKDEREETRAREPEPVLETETKPDAEPVVHRDLKPENVLETLMPPWAEAQIEAVCMPRLIDPATLDPPLMWDKYVASRTRDGRPLSEPDFRSYVCAWVANCAERRERERTLDARRKSEADEAARQRQPPAAGPMTKRTIPLADALAAAQKAAAAAMGGT